MAAAQFLTGRTVVQHVALEVCDMDPARVELRHVFGGRDPVIKHLGGLLWTELYTTGLGGQCMPRRWPRC